MLCMFFVMLILRLFDQIKHAKLLSECINVLFLYYWGLNYVLLLDWSMVQYLK